MRSFITIVENAQQYYLRLGTAPVGGQSQIGASANYSKHIERAGRSHELGVSVYPVEWDDEMNRWAIDCNNFATIDFLFSQRRPAYLVTGEHIFDPEHGYAHGQDSEPLLKNLTVVKELQYSELWVPGWGSDPLPEEYLTTDLVEDVQNEPRIDAEVRGDIAWVHDLHVPKASRGQGIGSKLYQEWEANLPENVKLVKLFAADYGDGRGNSDEFWEQLGFEHQYYGETMSYEGEHTMWKGVNGNSTSETVDWDAYDD